MTDTPIDWKAEVRRHLRDVPITEERQIDIVEEIAQDLEQRFAEFRRAGVELSDARRRVLAQLTDDKDLATRLAQLTRAKWHPPLPGLLRRPLALDTVAQDFRYAVRICVRRPGFTTVAVGAIGLGIASITAVFSLSHAVLLRPFPPAHFDRTVLVWQQDLPNGRDRITLSPLEYHAYGEATSISAIGAVRGLQLNVTGGDTPVAVSGVQVTPSLLDTLGVQPIVGSGFSEHGVGPTPEAMVTSEFWRTHLGADAGVVGRTISLQAGFSSAPPGSPSIDGSYVIVGVLPAGMSLPYRPADIWIPFSINATGVASTVPSLLVFARLDDGATRSQASAEVSAIGGRLATQYPERHRTLTTWLVTLREETVGDITPTLVLLGASVLLLGVMVCANTGTLLLSRLSERQRELTVRGALGATTGRLVRQLLAESVVLGLAGGLIGVVAAYWFVHLLTRAGPDTIPRVDEAAIDAWPWLVALGATVVMSALVSVIPVARLMRSSSLHALSIRTASSLETGRLRALLTIAEFAVAFVVIVGAGLVVSSAHALETASLGYDPTSTLTFRISLPQALYGSTDRRTTFVETLLDRLRALPGVSSVGAVNILPQMNTNRSIAVELEGPTSAIDARPTVRFRLATPGYFESLDIAIVEGRAFQATDVAARAVVVSRSMAERFWPNGGAVGRQLRFAPSAPWQTIVGVVGDVRQWIDTPAEPTLYAANQQQPEFAFVVRTTGDPASLSSSVGHVVRQIDPAQPVFDLRTMQDRLDRSQQLTYARFRTTIMSGFGLAALALAAMGIYGVVRYSVMQRMPEFGIRMALGASTHAIVKIVVAESLRMAAIGSVLGILGSMALSRLLDGVLYGSRAADSLIILAVGCGLVVLAVAAASGPARRASRSDPMQAVRAD